jgi:hypothetical protein
LLLLFISLSNLILFLVILKCHLKSWWVA